MELQIKIINELNPEKTLIFENDDFEPPTMTKSVGGNGLSIGNVIIGKFTANLISPYTVAHRMGFSGNIRPKPRAEVDFYCDDVLIGVYFIDKAPFNHGGTTYTGQRLKITCVDRLAMSNQPFAYHDPLNPAARSCSFDDALVWIANKLGCSYSFREVCYTGAWRFDITRGYTVREVLSMIAACSGGNWMMHGDVLTLIGGARSNRALLNTSEDSFFEPTVGWDYSPYCVTVTNGDVSETVGSDSTDDEYRTVSINVPVLDDYVGEIASALYSKLSKDSYIPFSLEKIKLPMDVDLYDNAPVNVCDGYITNLSVTYYADGAYGSISAPDPADSRSAFAYSRSDKKVGTDEKYSTISINYKYGVKTTDRIKPTDSVGADAATTIHEAVIDHAAVTFSDVTDETAVLALGSVYVDTTKDVKTANLKCADGALLTTAQDVVGAINELFCAGADSGWVRPADWPPYPFDPYTDSGKIGVLCSGETRGLSFYVSDSSYTVDWGDGTQSLYDAGHSAYRFYADFNDDGVALPVTDNSYFWVVVTIDSPENGRFSSYNSITPFISTGAPVDGATFINTYHEFISCEDVAVDYANNYGECNLLHAVLGPRCSGYCVASCAVACLEYHGDTDSLDIASYAYALEELKLPDITSLNIELRSNHGDTVITLPSGLTAINPTYARTTCFGRGITKIRIPNALETIPNGTFSYCYSLCNVEISPECSLVSIGDEAFYSCYALRNICLPSGLKHIGARAFSSCRTLSAVEFPDGLESIGEYAFDGCYALPAELWIPTSVTSVGQGAFSYSGVRRLHLPTGCTYEQTTSGTSIKIVVEYY